MPAKIDVVARCSVLYPAVPYNHTYREHQGMLELDCVDPGDDDTAPATSADSKGSRESRP